MRLEEIAHDTPRLVIEFKCPEIGKEHFGWGIIGTVPALSLVGFLIRVQSELVRNDFPKTCPEAALVVVYDADKIDEDKFDYFVGPTLPVNSLVGFIEIVKSAMLMNIVDVMNRNQPPRILGL